MQSSLNKYLAAHSSSPHEALDWLEKQTNLRTNYPQMLSGSVQGEFLKMLVEISGAGRVLEIGSFTGYSAICLALGLPDGGHLDAIEINDELEDLMREGWDRAGVSDRITLHIGDAIDVLKTFPTDPSMRYDFVFMDANKRQYNEYYELVLPLLNPGGLIVADDILWDGKVYAEHVPDDPQTEGIVRFNDSVAYDPRVEVVVLPLRDGISLIRKKY
ncbi:MAG: class I SAM-dependent methyltransferase [Bacteroidales bacterium]|nr:class I SAM-dependent methyltransferase [Bacteroidales bacterium]